MYDDSKEVEALLQQPGALWRLSVLVKEYEEKLYVIGLEVDRGIDRGHAKVVLQKALELVESDIAWVRHDSDK